MRSKGEGAQEAGVSAGVIDGLIDEGTLETVVLPPEPVVSQPDPNFHKPEFSLGQLAAADTLRTTVTQGGYTVTLLDGVTAPAKRKSTSRPLPKTSGCKRQTLILMPEIALTAQFLDRFSEPLRHPAGGVALAAFTAQTRAHMGGYPANGCR